MSPIERLFERASPSNFKLSARLRTAYGGDFGIDAPRTFANFVSSLDGVAALPIRGESGRVVSGGSEADRFVMALLRASADAIVIGAGTFRRSPGAAWTPAGAFPPLADDFAILRGRLGMRTFPLLVLVTASGRLDTAQWSAGDALIITTRAGEENLRGKLPSGARVEVFSADSVPIPDVHALLHSEGHGRVLIEGGPKLFGEWVKANLVDELFLTASPRLFGRRDGDGKMSIVDGVDLGEIGLELVSVRRSDSHLFLRYTRAEGPTDRPAPI